MGSIRDILIASLIGLIAMPAAAAPLATQLFGAKSTPSQQTPQAIGSYAKGCAAGNVQLPETGPTWQAMRLSRNRNYGQPEMISFVEDLSAYAATLPGWNGLYVGDISQPRGGPMTSGHASHQLGLDADIWMLPAGNVRLSRAKRENISSIDVRSKDQRSVNGNWTPAHAALLERAASDPRVDRIFVTPPVKIELCKSAKRSDTKWLQKIRPYWGHNYHFHVRLKCPKGDRACVTQRPNVAELSNGGNGCDASLNWWVTDMLNPPKSTAPAKPAPKKRGPREFTMADLPAQCVDVLSSR
ncbi:penicillin-insensitive murein endopeptidase [Tropicimonas sp. IMCC34043]|uniref:penicillin-insensitive murein endopeptidase n=1 Tax=Tropicimonas sp. IMCC34043 TaxID=2248760 RepID=UPI000E2477E8|nr:penicillin-insensitive murein endopeptidase [Tropicimonas sp. IMCC34043]